MDLPEDEQEKINEILNNMNHIVESGKLDDFKDIIDRVNAINNKDLFRTCSKNRGFDLISLICKHNKKKLLRHLLNKPNILYYFTSEDKCAEMKYREDAFYYAICLSHFELIEIMYDHWTGDLHCLGHKKENEFDIENLNQLYNSLQTARDRYMNRILSKTFLKRRIDQYMMFNIQSLIGFNEFQRDLYRKLNEFKRNLMTWENKPEDVIRLQETYAIRNMILAVLDFYNIYTKKPESMIENSFYENPAVLMESLKDSSTLLPQTSLYVIYEVYFRKLDYNTCLLILDNLHSLKLRLSMPEDSYQNLENNVFLFIYHVSSKWSLFMPKRKKMKTITSYVKDYEIDCLFSLKYNANAFESGPHIIYLERKSFENAINYFKTNLKNRNVKENLRKDQIELPNKEVNCLMLLPDLRDIYSLKRMSQYIAQLHSVDVDKCRKEYVYLLVERTLQVVGEFLKSTDKTSHLHPTTEALMKAEISVEVVNDLKILRDMLCHVKDGELLKKIETELTKSDIFYTVLQELMFVKKKIDEVIMIQKPIVERDLILNSLSLIEIRKNKMPYIVANDFFIILKTLRFQISNENNRLAEENIFYKMCWEPAGFTEELMAELKILLEHSLHLESKLLSVTKKIRSNLIRKYLFYKEAINNSFQKIIAIKANWFRIVKALKDKIHSITLLDYPNEDDANRIKSYSKKVDLMDDSLSRLVEEDTLFSDAKNHWSFIKKILEFVVLKTQIGYYTADEWKKVTANIETLGEVYRNIDMEKIVNNYMVKIENKLGTVPQIRNRDQYPEFTGIKELTHRLTMVNFLTHEEKTHLTETLESTKSNSNEKVRAKIDNMVKKINNDLAIPNRHFTSFINTIQLDKKVQKILMNLVMGFKRDPLIPWCLSKRISLLKELTKNQSIDQLILKYKLDKCFRILFEVLLFDIFSALEDIQIIKKSSRLLTEINLRNILIHGSPLLEIVGNVLDSNDLPTELITKALDLVEDETSINALCDLKYQDFDFTQINNNLLNPEHQALVIKLKVSNRWKEYIKLIPEFKQTTRRHKKSKTVIDQKSMDLLKAVTDKDAVLVQKIIDEGANVNFVDSRKYAFVHHAAMKGSVDVIRVLLDNGVDVNFRGKYNMTALHCSAMNGFIDSVEFLLKSGADCFSVDDRGRTPMDVASQRNHGNIRQILLEAMKK